MSTIEAFKSLFPTWPDDSLAKRSDQLGPGSSWDKRELGTFQIIRESATREPPEFFEPHLNEATKWVRQCEDIKVTTKLLHQNWRNLTHQELASSAGKFAPFFTLLAQVLETPIVIDTQRELRSQKNEEASEDHDGLASSSSPSFPYSSSPASPPKKRMRRGCSSDSYAPSDQSDQSSHNHRTKSEMTTNACIYELLRCVTELVRGKAEPRIYLEWSITYDTFIVKAGKLTYSTTNDGSLVHKASRDGYWQRASQICHCSIEAKSWYNADDKPINVQAQEAAHFVGMYSQYTRDGSALQDEMVLPLISAAQNVFSIVFAKFPAEYARYLFDGSQPESGVFVELVEFGMFQLQKPQDLLRIFSSIVALHSWLQSVTPII